MIVPEIQTERLVMRGFGDADLDELAAINEDPEVTRWVGDEHGLTREDTWRRMAYWVGHWELRGFGQWALIERAGGRLLVGREHWGRGFAPEAGRASMEWAREELGADHVISLIEDSNERSARVAEKLGMTVEGRTRIVNSQYEVRIFGADLGTSSA